MTAAKKSLEEAADGYKALAQTARERGDRSAAREHANNAKDAAGFAATIRIPRGTADAAEMDRRDDDGAGRFSDDLTFPSLALSTTERDFKPVEFLGKTFHEGKRIQIFRPGRYVKDEVRFTVDEAFLNAVAVGIREQEAEGQPVPFDYNHAAVVRGEEAKAAGFLKPGTVEVNASGMFGVPLYTKSAADAIGAGEWNFVSPWFALNAPSKTEPGKRVGPRLKVVALTNTPFLHGMDCVALSAGNRDRGGDDNDLALYNENHDDSGRFASGGGGAGGGAQDPTYRGHVGAHLRDANYAKADRHESEAGRLWRARTNLNKNPQGPRSQELRNKVARAEQAHRFAAEAQREATNADEVASADEASARAERMSATLKLSDNNEELPMKTKDLLNRLHLTATTLALSDNGGDDDVTDAVLTKVADHIAGLAAAKAKSDAAVLELGDRLTATEASAKASAATLAKLTADTKVTDAIRKGKLAPALKAWGTDLALSDAKAFDTYIEKAPALALTSKEHGHNGGVDGEVEAGASGGEALEAEFSDAVMAVAERDKCDVRTARAKVRAEKPDLYKRYTADR